MNAKRSRNRTSCSGESTHARTPCTRQSSTSAAVTTDGTLSMGSREFLKRKVRRGGTAEIGGPTIPGKRIAPATRVAGNKKRQDSSRPPVEPKNGGRQASRRTKDGTPSPPVEPKKRRESFRPPVDGSRPFGGGQCRFGAAAPVTSSTSLSLLRAATRAKSECARP